MQKGINFKKKGAFPLQSIREFARKGFIETIQDANIRPGSLDLVITSEGYRVNGAFLPAHNETVEEAIRRVNGKPFKEDGILEKGCCYTFKLAEYMNLPKGIYGYCNPKSSSGRIDLHVRLLADGVSRYDTVPQNYNGPLWVMIVPKTFPVILKSGITLNQIRFFNGDTRFNEDTLQKIIQSKEKILFNKNKSPIKPKDIRHSDKDGSLLMSLGLNFPIPGFEAIETKDPIDLSKKDYYDPKYFFKPITIRDNCLVLRNDTFYILSTKECVRVPANFACEMKPMDEKSGDIRSHYAGFIDPGWGIGSSGKGFGRPFTLEVRSFDNGIIIQDGQPIAKICYEKMNELPIEHYDQMAPTYGEQNGPKLAKYFKDWK